MLGVRELLRRDADEIEGRVAAHIVPELAQSYGAPCRLDRGEFRRHDDQVIVALRVCLARGVRAKKQDTLSRDLVPQPLRKSAERRLYDQGSCVPSHMRILSAAFLYVPYHACGPTQPNKIASEHAMKKGGSRATYW